MAEDVLDFINSRFDSAIVEYERGVACRVRSHDTRTRAGKTWRGKRQPLWRTSATVFSCVVNEGMYPTCEIMYHTATASCSTRRRIGFDHDPELV